ncbi:hypothetical protein ACFLS8_00895 [Chloroflexota bacterium]
MPRGDGTGPPWGSGPGTGRGVARGSKGAGRMRGTSPGAGPGECVCPKCKARMPHQAGIPCYNLSCPKCGAQLARG